ncbi:histidinol-phosphate transaminase [Halanaerobium hydrogeniformans]|uniref:histidinol-phosphate transaminase n=1 Tax=Halanaerobium hydrogeniformans TaxID=656519 RepID=UPI00031C346F|nr:histidinol-phosphate transaminase [Halanaerobium hydrogeniformans]
MSNNQKDKEKIIKEMLRDEVRSISPYYGEEDDFEVKINLAGNESPFDLPAKIKDKFINEFQKTDINRYPEIYSEKIHQELADYLSSELNKEVSTKEVIIGNGSDELLDILIRTFVEKGDIVLSQAPTFSMYRYFSELGGGIYEEIPLDKDFTIENIKAKIDRLQPKLIFFCSPNNPTGEILAKDLILSITEYFSGPVIVDEAYADFSKEDLMAQVENHANLAVTRTFSKAFGLAGIRLGYLYGNSVLVEELKKVLKPYNLNTLTDILGCIVLNNNDIIKERIEFIKKERERVFEHLKSYSDWDLFPSEANFIYLEGKKTHLFKKALNQAGIKIRSYNTKPAAIRITIGSEEENDAVLRVLEEFKQNN